MREVDYGDRKPLLKFISKEIKMTKYIDRYYLNWELYGIKFAPDSVDFDDSFQWTSLNTNIWESTQYGNEWSLVVNNWLTISSWNSDTWNTWRDQYLKMWYTISTNAKYTGNETKITVEITYTWYTLAAYDWWSFSILGSECRDGPWAMDSVTWAIYTTWSGRWYSLAYLNGSQALSLDSHETFSNPTVVKCILDITNDTSYLYVNDVLECTKNNLLYTWYSYSDYIWNPLLTISPRYGECSINISNVKLTVE